MTAEQRVHVQFIEHVTKGPSRQGSEPRFVAEGIVDAVDLSRFAFFTVSIAHTLYYCRHGCLELPGGSSHHGDVFVLLDLRRSVVYDLERYLGPRLLGQVCTPRQQGNRPSGIAMVSASQDGHLLDHASLHGIFMQCLIHTDVQDALEIDSIIRFENDFVEFQE